ncbi:hypothetical protein [Albidovulum sp.]
MRQAMLTVLLALGLGGPAGAEDWALRPGDEVIAGADLAAWLDGRVARFHDGGRSVYGPGTAYAYVYRSGERAEGEFRIEAPDRVCVAFRNGWSRCDKYVRRGGRILLLDQQGNRFPLSAEAGGG